MSEGGTIKGKNEQIQKQLDAESKRWEAAGLPPPQAIYQLGPNQFMHHCHVLAISRLLIEKLGVSEEEAELTLKEVALEESKQLFDLALQARREQIARGIFGPNGNPLA